MRRHSAKDDLKSFSRQGDKILLGENDRHVISQSTVGVERTSFLSQFK